MKTIPFEAAKKICEEYQKNQCIILAYDGTSKETWVTTFGTTDSHSWAAAETGNELKKMLGFKDYDDVPERFKEWKIESVDRYYYASGRNYNTYKEVTYWYNPRTLERKETVREQTISTGSEYELEEWAKGITRRNKSLDWY